jgi:putative FmdB family regulatory protein
MPIREYHCKDCDCTFENLELKESDRPEKCEKCGSGTIERKISTYGGYFMDSGPASIRPKQAGSFKVKK